MSVLSNATPLNKLFLPHMVAATALASEFQVVFESCSCALNIQMIFWGDSTEESKATYVLRNHHDRIGSSFCYSGSSVRPRVDSVSLKKVTITLSTEV